MVRVIRLSRPEATKESWNGRFSLVFCFYIDDCRCGPCRFIGPIFEALAAKTPEAEFVKVDVDDADDVAATCGIQAMPTFHFYKGGVKVDEMMGADKDTLERKVAQHK